MIPVLPNDLPCHRNEIVAAIDTLEIGALVLLVAFVPGLANHREYSDANAVDLELMKVRRHLVIRAQHDATRLRDEALQRLQAISEVMVADGPQVQAKFLVDFNRRCPI